MTDARWTDVDDDLDAACRHFGHAADLFDDGGFECGWILESAV